MPEDQTNTDHGLDPEQREAIKEGEALVLAGLEEMDYKLARATIESIRNAYGGSTPGSIVTALAVLVGLAEEESPALHMAMSIVFHIHKESKTEIELLSMQEDDAKN